ncbi:cupin domain-containing protein [Allopontixanthobacter sediminis]|nr:cupin domain-containing protein [Allopontixanthobacter sediminis]
MNNTMTAGSGPFVFASDRSNEEVDPGIFRQMLSYGAELMICRVTFAAGAKGSVHSHPHSQATYVESGRFKALVGGAERELAAGDSIYIEPNVDHGTTCIEAGVLIDTFSPLREDFLADAELVS